MKKKSLLGFLALVPLLLYFYSCVAVRFSSFLIWTCQREETHKHNPSINIIPLTLYAEERRRRAEQSAWLETKHVDRGRSVGGQSDCCRKRELTRKKGTKKGKDKTNHWTTAKANAATCLLSSSCPFPTSQSPQHLATVCCCNFLVSSFSHLLSIFFSFFNLFIG